MKFLYSSLVINFFILEQRFRFMDFDVIFPESRYKANINQNQLSTEKIFSVV